MAFFWTRTSCLRVQQKRNCVTGARQARHLFLNGLCWLGRFDGGVFDGVLDGVFDDTGSATSNTDEMRRREDNVDSALILRARAELQLRVCGRG